MQRKEDERKSNSAVAVAPSRTDHGDESLLRALTGLRYAKYMHTILGEAERGPSAPCAWDGCPSRPAPGLGLALRTPSSYGVEPKDFLCLSI